MAYVGARLYKIVGANLGPYECYGDGVRHWHLYSLSKPGNSKAKTRRTANQKKRKKQRQRLWVKVKSPQEPGPLGCILGF
jgi:hypothetical protein